jgi:uncharacterized protein YjlB
VCGGRDFDDRAAVYAKLDRVHADRPFRAVTIEERPRALKTIPKVPPPRKDPVYGTGGPLSKLWKKPK